jgi:hypothetical protein
MPDLDNIKMPELIDMLAKHKDDHTRLLHDGSKEDYENCKASILMLEAEIIARRPVTDSI